MPDSLSDKDMKILNLVKENARYTARQISEKTGIPITTIHNRIRTLEQEGVIRGYTAKLNRKKIGKPLQAFIHVEVEYILPGGNKLNQEELARKILKMPEVEECHIMAGTTDILIKVAVADVEELNQFVIHRLRNLDGVVDTVTAIVLKDVSE
ncbi:MAG: Lrp/AsnC family transcriptional regulator [Candidatus Aenigmarchaeota archaeon]|nr:Lrp/AsnC family transcriptional regulator [Candidatus Aenigmarchaeota archaeon]